MSIDLTFRCPIDANYKGWGGGPKTGGHTVGGWDQVYGNDFGCTVGTPVYAAFDCKIYRWWPNLLDGASADGKKYGIQMHVKNWVADGHPDNDKVRAYYTHVNNLKITADMTKVIKRGTQIGVVTTAAGKIPAPPDGGKPPPAPGVHLHFAMIERITPDWDKFAGIELPKTFEGWHKAGDGGDHVVRFANDGTTAPVVDPAGATAPAPAAPPAGGNGAAPGGTRTEADAETEGQYASLSAGESDPGMDWSCSCLDGNHQHPSQCVGDDCAVQEPVALARMPRRAAALGLAPALLSLQRAAGNRASAAALGELGPQAALLARAADAPERDRTAAQSRPRAAEGARSQKSDTGPVAG